MVGNLILHFLIGEDLNFSKESLGDTNKRILGPLMEPIDGSTVDETGEHTCADTESFTNGGEAERNVEVFAHLVNEELEEGARGILNTLGLSLSAALANDTIKLILSEELRNVTSGEDIVDVDKEIILDDLGISQDEEGGLANNTRLHVGGLDVSLKVHLVVVGGNNNSEHVLSDDEGSQLGEGLLSGTTHTDEQG